MNKDIKLLAEAYYKVLENTDTNTVVGGDPAYDKRNEQEDGVLQRDPNSNDYVKEEGDENLVGKVLILIDDTWGEFNILGIYDKDQIAKRALLDAQKEYERRTGLKENSLKLVKVSLNEEPNDRFLPSEEEESSDPNWQQAARQQLSQTGQLASPNQGFNMKPGFFGPNKYTPIPGEGKFD